MLVLFLDKEQKIRLLTKLISGFHHIRSYIIATTDLPILRSLKSNPIKLCLSHFKAWISP